MLDLSSFNAKVNRGDDHLRTLNDEVRRWQERESWTFVKERSDDYTIFHLGVVIDEMPDLHHWAALVGDLVSNYRAALDHLVYAVGVAESGSDPPPDEGKLAFPLCDTSKLFKKQAWRLTSLSSDAFAAIKRTQPFDGADHAGWRVLRVLRDLNDSDKHRKVHLSALHLREITAEWEGVIPGDAIVTVNEQAELGPSETPLVMFRFAQPQTNPDMAMEFDLTFGITLGDGPLRKRPKLDTLGDIRQAVLGVSGVIREALS
jgi:hypothetical protein